MKKCEFGSNNVAYLGFRLTPQGIKPGSDKLKAVGQTPPPANVKEVRQFLGLCNFFRGHVKNFALVSSPLTVLTKKDSPWKKGPLPPEAHKAYRELQTILCSQPVVAYPRSDRKYALITDASCGDDKKPGGLGAILAQIDDHGKFYVIAYASRKLSKHEQNYTAFLLEMQAAVWAMDHFGVNLKGRNFILYTDHKPLEKLGKVHTKTLNRLQEAMNQFSFQIIYKKGAEMPADYLSRNAVDAIQLDSLNLSNMQKQDTLILAIREFLFNRNLPDDTKLVKLVKLFAEDCFISEDLLWRRIIRGNDLPRVVLFTPSQITNELIAQAHGQLLTGHDGVFKTKERLLESYYWPGMDKQILEFIKHCHKCQTTKKYHPLGKEPIQPLPQCSQLNQRIHADLFGPLKTSEKGKKYILCITDAFTKYVELVAIPDKEASTIAAAIFHKWICRYGCPLQITTDNGKEFCAKLSDQLFQKLGTNHSTTTPYHPQCNSQVEIVNKTIAKYLASFVDESTLDWELYLPPLMFCYNTSVHTSTKTSPHFLTYGYFPRLPNLFGEDINKVFYGENSVDEMLQQLQHARQIAAQNNDNIRDKYIQWHDKSLKPQTFEINQQVLLDEQQFLHKNRKLAPKYDGPFTIHKLLDTNAEIIGKNGRRYVVHLNRLKPYFSAQDDFNAPHFLDLYKNFKPLDRTDSMVNHATSTSPAENLRNENFVDQQIIRPKRGRPRKNIQIVSDNLFETERDARIVSRNFQNDLSRDNANEPANGLETMTNDAFNDVGDKRITRSTLKTLSNENQQNYFQSLNFIRDKNKTNKNIEIYEQKVFTIVTKKRKIKRNKNGTTNINRKLEKTQQKNFNRFGDSFKCVENDWYHEEDGDELGLPILLQQPGIHQAQSSDEGSEEEIFSSASDGTSSSEEEMADANEEPPEPPGPVLALPGPVLPINRPEAKREILTRGGGQNVRPTQGPQRHQVRLPNLVGLPPGIRRETSNIIPSPAISNRGATNVPRSLGARPKESPRTSTRPRSPSPERSNLHGGRRGRDGPLPGGTRNLPTTTTADRAKPRIPDIRSPTSAYDAHDQRPVGVRKPDMRGSTVVEDLAGFYGLSDREISRAEIAARIDDEIFTPSTTRSPVRSRAKSQPTTPGRSGGPERRAKTPERNHEEREAQDTIKGVSHAKARLILDKRAAAENRPAQIIRSTRSNTEAPPIWPIPSKSKDIKGDSPQKVVTQPPPIFGKSSKLKRTP